MDSPDRNYIKYWTGHNGIIGKMRPYLGMNSNNSYKLQRYFETMMKCIRIETDFHPKLMENSGGKRELTIRMDIPEAQIIADGLEYGLSIQNT